MFVYLKFNKQFQTPLLKASMYLIKLQWTFWRFLIFLIKLHPFWRLDVFMLLCFYVFFLGFVFLLVGKQWYVSRYETCVFFWNIYVPVFLILLRGASLIISFSYWPWIQGIGDFSVRNVFGLSVKQWLFYLLFK